MAISSLIIGIGGPKDRLFVAFGLQRFREVGAIPGLGTSVDWTYQIAGCWLEGAAAMERADLGAQVMDIAVSPNGKRWATSVGIGVPPAISLHDKLTGHPLAQYRPKGSKNPPGRLTYSPDGRYIAATSGRTIPLLNADSLEPVAVLSGHTAQLNAIAFSPDSRWLLSASHDGAIRIWDTAKRKIH